MNRTRQSDEQDRAQITGPDDRDRGQGQGYYYTRLTRYI
jgi:hypothetical protein